MIQNKYAILMSEKDMLSRELIEIKGTIIKKFLDISEVKLDSESSVQDYIEQLISRYDETQALHTKISHLKESHADEVSYLNSNKECLLKKLNHLETEYETQLSYHAQEINSLKQSFNKTRQEDQSSHKSELNAMQTAFKQKEVALCDHYDKKLKDLKSSYEDEIQSQAFKLALEIENLKASHQTEVNKLDQIYQAEIESLQQINLECKDFFGSSLELELKKHEESWMIRHSETLFNFQNEMKSLKDQYLSLIHI